MGFGETIFGEKVYEEKPEPEFEARIKKHAENITARINKYPETPAEAIARLATYKEPKWRIPGPTGLMETFASHHAKIPLLECCYSYKKLVAGQYWVVDNVENEFPQADFDVYNIEAEALGCKLLRPITSYPCVAPDGEIIKEKADLDKLRVPDLSTEARGPFFAGIMKTIFETLPGLITPFYFHITPWDIGFKTMGFTRLIKWARKDPEFLWKALDFFVDIAIDYGKFQYEDIVKPTAPTLTPFMWAAACDVPLIGIKNWEEYAMPSAMKVIKKLPYDNWGVFRFYEAVDDWKQFWQHYMDNSGVTVFMYGMDTRIADLATAKKITAKNKKLFVVGTDAETINYSALEILDERVRRHIRDTAPGGGAVSVKLDTVSPACTMQRYKYLIRKVKEYGTFPIDVEALQPTESTAEIKRVAKPF
jgi:uroporphyrinogen-III decarboxylase